MPALLVLLLVAAGVACDEPELNANAEEDDGEETSSALWRAEASFRERHRRAESPGPLVSSTAEGDDGGRYVAGVFSGTLVIGGIFLKSHGGDDIFVARLEPHGAASWAHAVGSRHDERGPKVSFADGRVVLVGMTAGAVDCGEGSLSTWSTETFFVCTFDPDGAPISGASFPTGRVGRASGASRRDGPATDRSRAPRGAKDDLERVLLWNP